MTVHARVGGRGALLPSAGWYPVCGSIYGVAGQGALREGRNSGHPHGERSDVQVEGERKF